MASHISVNENLCWDKFHLIKRSMDMISQQFLLNSNKIEYKKSEEEEELHRYRNHIDTYDNILTNHRNWEYYKKIVNPYEFVYTQRKYEYFPESICKLRPLSRSYFKMVEMMELLNFFNESNNVKYIRININNQ